MPYLLPDGDAYTSDRRCIIVSIPDKDEYMRAFLGSIDYLGTWVAWERDSAHRGRDAARAWKEANELTRGCIMSCDDIITLLTQIRDKDLCCPVDIYDNPAIAGDPYSLPAENTTNPRVTIPAGTPDYDGDGNVDADDVDALLCLAAEKFADTGFPDYVSNLKTLHTISGIGIAALLGALTAAYSTILIGAAVAGLTSVTWLLSKVEQIADLLGVTPDPFTPTLIDIALYREDIICAIYDATDAEDAYSNLNTLIQTYFQYPDLVDGLWLQWLMRKVFDTSNISTTGSGFGGCTCGPGAYQAIWTWDTDAENWVKGNPSGGGGWYSNQTYTIQQGYWSYVSCANLALQAGWAQSGQQERITRIELDLVAGGYNPVPEGYSSVYVDVWDGSAWQRFGTLSGWTYGTQVMTGDVTTPDAVGTQAIRVGVTGTGNQWIYMDNFKVWMTSV